MDMTPALQNQTPSAPRQPESGIAVIMVLIILLLMAVLSLGFMVTVRNMADTANSLFHYGLVDNAAFSGQMRAIAALRKDYLTNTGDDTYTLGDGSQIWQNEFALDDPDDLDDPLIAARHIWHGVMGTRLDQSENYYGGGMTEYRALDDGAYTGEFNAGGTFNEDYLTHDGTGKWFYTDKFDRYGNPVEDLADARFAVRYAVGVVDLSGRILVNPLSEVRANRGYMTTLTDRTTNRYNYDRSTYTFAVHGEGTEESPYTPGVDSYELTGLNAHPSIQPSQSKASLVAHFFYQSLDDNPWDHDNDTISEGWGWGGATQHRTDPRSRPEDRVTGGMLRKETDAVRRMSQRFDTGQDDEYGFDLYNWHQIMQAHSQNHEDQTTETTAGARGRLGKTDTFWDTTYLFTPYGGAFAADGYTNINAGRPNPVQWVINVNTAPKKVLEAAIVAMDNIISFEERHYNPINGTADDYTWVQIHGYFPQISPSKEFYLEPKEDDMTAAGEWRAIKHDDDVRSLDENDMPRTARVTDSKALGGLGWMKKIREESDPEAKLSTLVTQLKTQAEEGVMTDEDPRIDALLKGTHFILVQEMKSRFFRVAVHAQFFDKLQGPLAEKRVDFVYVLAPQDGSANTPGDIKGSHILYYHVADDPRIIK